MEENKTLDVFEKAPVPKAVLQNALPAMAVGTVFGMGGTSAISRLWEREEETTPGSCVPSACGAACAQALLCL